MKHTVLGYGAGGHAGVIVDILEDNKKYEIIGLIDKSNKKSAHGLKIIGDDTKLKYFYDKKSKNIFFGLAGIKTIKKNILLYEKLEKVGFNIIDVIHTTSIISKKAKIGKGVKVFAGVKVNSNVKIGKNVFLNTGCIIEHDCQIDDHSQIGPGAYLSGGVKVGRGSFIGIGVRINEKVKIADNCLIGAGSVVTKNTAKDTIYAGVPAKKIGKI